MKHLTCMVLLIFLSELFCTWCLEEKMMGEKQDLRVINNQLITEGYWTLVNQNALTNEGEETNNPFPEYLSHRNGECHGLFFDSVIRDIFENDEKVDSVSLRFHNPKYIDQNILIIRIHLNNSLYDVQQQRWTFESKDPASESITENDQNSASEKQDSQKDENRQSEKGQSDEEPQNSRTNQAKKESPPTEQEALIANFSCYENLQLAKFGRASITSLVVDKESIELKISKIWKPKNRQGSEQSSAQTPDNGSTSTLEDYEVVELANPIELEVSYHPKTYPLLIPIVITIYNVILLWVFVRLDRKQGPNTENLSLISLYHLVFFTIYMSTLFLIVGISSLLSNVYGLFIAVGVMQMIICVRLIRKFESIIVHITNLNGYFIFYALVFVYIWSIFNYYYTSIFIFANTLLSLSPQIVHNARNGNRLNLRKYWEYIVLLCSPHAYFLYLKGDSDNIMKYSPDLLLCSVVIGLIIAQIVVIYQQNVKGPVFFIPKACLPNYFNYYQTFVLDSNSQLYSEECTICLGLLSENYSQNSIVSSIIQSQQQGGPSINTNHQNQSVQPRQSKEMKRIQNQNSKQTEEIKSDSSLRSEREAEVELSSSKKHSSKGKLHAKKTVTLMVTPCKHKFHPQCLIEWAECKRECPIDRSPLPIIY